MTRVSDFRSPSWLVLALLCGFAASGGIVIPPGLWGQDAGAGSSGVVAPAAGAEPDYRRVYDEAVGELRRLTKEASRARLSFQTGTREESEEHRQAWDAAIAAGERQRLVVEEAALQLYAASKEPPKDVQAFLYQVHGSYVLGGFWSKAERVAKLLRPSMSEDEGFLSRDATAALSSNNFAAAAKFRASFGHLIPNLSKSVQRLFEDLPDLEKKYERELKFLEEDAAGEPLPRVLLKTTKGRIEVELFENQAPDTVGNFIHLVENGFYTNLNFHRVIPGFMAQTGGYNTQKMARDPGYSIFDEYEQKEARDHFEGYLSMANAGVPHTGSSQFFLTLVPTAHLDGKHTVFGRIISGQEVLESLVKTHQVDREGEEKEIPGVTPDAIISAEVLRKRDHEYRPRKVQ